MLMLALAALTGCASQATFGDAITRGEPTAIPTPVVPSKPVYQVERGKIVYERRFFGRITPLITETIAFEIDGRVLEVFVEGWRRCSRRRPASAVEYSGLGKPAPGCRRGTGDRHVDLGSAEARCATIASGPGSPLRWRNSSSTTPSSSRAICRTVLARFKSTC